ASGCAQDAVARAGVARAARAVEQDVVDGVADPAAERGQRIGLRGADKADAARRVAVDVGPVAIGFDAEHPGSALPVVADLTTGKSAGRIHVDGSGRLRNPIAAPAAAA